MSCTPLPKAAKPVWPKQLTRLSCLVEGSDSFQWQLSRRRAWLTIWDKVKSHGTLIDWCTGREWPMPCMTVISVWWRSNMLFQRLSGRLNYYITRWRQEVSQFGVRRVWWQDAEEKASIQQRPGSPGLRASGWATLENEKDTTLMAIRVGVNMLQFCSVTNSLSHTPTFQLKWEVYFFKEVFARLYYCVNMYSACICVYMHIYYGIIQHYCMYIINFLH